MFLILLGLLGILSVGLADAGVVPEEPELCLPQENTNLWNLGQSFYYTYSHPDDCHYYYACENGLSHLKECSEGTRYSPVVKKCVTEFSHYDTCSRDNAERECERDTSSLIAHPEACQRYFNCSDNILRSPRSRFRPYETECPYPQLFDLTEKKCKLFKEAVCGPGRVAAKDPCEYLNNVCGSAHCEPCRSRLPSCVGLDDGLHEHPQRIWTPFYIECDTERLINQGRCETHSFTLTTGFFSPIKKECVSKWEVPRDTGYGLAPDCDGQEEGQYRADESPSVYYRCPGAQVFYCPAGSIFNESIGQCKAED